MNIVHSLFSHTLVYGLSSVLARVLNFLLVPLYTALFVPSEFAIVSELYAYAALLMVICSFGMETTFFRFFQNNRNYPLSSVFSSSFFFLSFNAFLLLCLGVGFSQRLAHLIGYSQHPEYILYFVIIIVLDILTIIPFALLRQQNRSIKFATIKTINILVNISFNILFLVVFPYFYSRESLPAILNFAYSPPVSVVYIFISNLFASCVTLVLLFPEIKRNIGAPSCTIFKQMFMYAWPILIAGVAFVINETADKLLIKYLLPRGIAMQELGIYAACYKLTIFMTLFVQAYRFAAEPIFFNQFKQSNAKIVYSLMMQVFILFGLGIFLFVTLHIDSIKLIIVNPLYHQGLVIIPIILMANIFLGIYYNLSVWYKVTNRTIYAAYISLLGSLVTIGAGEYAPIPPVLGPLSFSRTRL